MENEKYFIRNGICDIVRDLLMDKISNTIDDIATQIIWTNMSDNILINYFTINGNINDELI